MFGQEPQSIHRTPIALVTRIPKAGSRALCGRCGAGARAKPRAVFCATSTPVQACRPAPAHCSGGVRAPSVPCGSLPAPLLLPASERVGQATRGTHVGCRAAFLVVLLFFTNSAPLFFPPVFPAAIFVCLCCCAIEGVLYTCRHERREKKKSWGIAPPLRELLFQSATAVFSGRGF